MSTISSPVVGTNNGNALERDDSSCLSGNLSGQAWKALADAAAALQAAASAIAGLNGKIPVSICHTSSSDPVTVSDAINEFLRAKAKAGRCERYLRALRVSLNSFKNGRSRDPIGSVTIADIERWLDSQHWAPRTKCGYLSDVRTMFNFAVRRGLAKSNPAAAVELPVVVSTPAAIHTPSQARTVLDFARGYDLNLCRCLAIRYFAGLRTSEGDRLREPDLHDGFVEVTAANAKTRRRRLVKVQPNLRAWLDLGGSLDFGNRGNRWAWFTLALKSKTGIEWEHNVTRHSFASYHLQQFRNAGDTALEAGHSQQMLFAHYREVVTTAAAAEFWGIVPK